MRARSEPAGGGASRRRRTAAGPVPRLTAEARRAQILARATEFFAEHGLAARTRALAEACGVAQRLLYRYFPSKAALLAAVYEQAIVAPFQAVWLVRLRDRSQPLEDRLEGFYRDYLATVLTRRWLRLFLHASLAEARLAPDFIQAIILEMLETIVAETAHDRRVALPRDRALAHEIGWLLHGAISHFAIRRHLYGASQSVAAERVIAMQVRGFVAGFAAMTEAGRARPAPARRRAG